MMQRLTDFLRRRRGDGAQPPLRPNELRRDLVQAERQRRETRRMPASTPVDEATAPRQRPLALPVQPVRTVNPVLRGLQTRSGLRQAWLMTEILGPPVSLRGVRDEGREA